MKNISICIISFMMLFVFSVLLFLISWNFMVLDYSLFIEWEIVKLNSVSFVMTFLFDWMSLLFMSFVLFISSLVFFYSE